MKHSVGGCMERAYNAATRGNKVANIQYLPEGDATITLNGRYSPSADRLVWAVGLEAAWQFFVKDCCVAYSAVADRLLRQKVY